MIMQVALELASGTINTPAGWTLVLYTTHPSAAAIATATFIRVANSSEPAFYTVTTGNQVADLAITTYEGVDVTTPQDVAAVAGTSVISTALTWASITPVTPGALIINAHAGANASANYTVTPPAGNTERYDFGQSTAFWNHLEMSDFIHPTATATGVKNGTASVSAYHIPHTLALRPVLTRTGTDNLGITDSEVHQKGILKTDAEGITDSRVLAQSLSRTNPVGITDSVLVDHVRPAVWSTGRFVI
jgi:hypothetical protein